MTVNARPLTDRGQVIFLCILHHTQHPFRAKAPAPKTVSTTYSPLFGPSLILPVMSSMTMLIGKKKHVKKKFQGYSGLCVLLKGLFFRGLGFLDAHPSKPAVKTLLRLMKSPWIKKWGDPFRDKSNKNTVKENIHSYWWKQVWRGMERWKTMEPHNIQQKRKYHRKVGEWSITEM